MTGPTPDTLSVRELKSLGIEITAKIELVLVYGAMYKRDRDGVWYRLGGAAGLDAAS